jgi:hypothetical protein
LTVQALILENKPEQMMLLRKQAISDACPATPKYYIPSEFNIVVEGKYLLYSFLFTKSYAKDPKRMWFQVSLFNPNEQS